MRRGGRVLTLLGLVLGLLTAGGTFFVLSSAQPQTQQVQTQPIVVALQPIPERTEIRPDAVGLQNWPEPVPANAMSKVEDVIGKLSLVPIYQGQLIMPPMIVDKTKAQAAHSNAAFIIPEGKVAVAFPSSDLVSVAGAIQPGDYVDLMLTLSPGTITLPPGTRTTTTGTEGQSVTQLMLQNVLILQIGSWGATSGQGGGGGGGGTITFVLDRQDALALKSAREQGIIEFALRSATDQKTATTEPVTLQYLNKRFNFNLLPAAGR